MEEIKVDVEAPPKELNEKEEEEKVPEEESEQIKAVNEKKGKESNLKNIKNKIIEITKPVMEKKEAETLAVLRQGREKKLADKTETTFFEPHGGNDDKDLQNGKKPVSQPQAPTEHVYKILFMGEVGTGKTSIIKRYVHRFFSENYRSTVGVDFALKVLNWDQNTTIRLQLWDIAGQERYGTLTRVYYKEAVGAFIVFDVTRSATLDIVAKWKEDLDYKVQLKDGRPIPCILLANKCDQRNHDFVINKVKMDEYCYKNGFSTWYETSAKENINIEEAFRSLVSKILQNDKCIGKEEVSNDIEKFFLDSRPEDNNQRSCSC